MAIIETYDRFFEYIYPIACNMSHKHRELKQQLQSAILLQYRLFHDAAKTSCKRTLRLIELYHCPYTLGIKIGWLSSQLLANICGHILDRYLAHQVKAKHWYRYMDDVVIFAHTREYLEALQQELTLFVYEQMGMTWSKWSITPAAAGVNFLGYRIWPTHKLLRRDSVKKAKRKITRLKKLEDPEPLRCFLAAWLGHAKWANTYNLTKYLEIEHEMALRPNNQRANHRHTAG